MTRVMKKDGQSAIEAAFTIPITVFILFAIIVYGFALNSKIALTFAAREAARSYAVNKDEDLMRNVVENELKKSIPLSDSQFSQSFNKYSDVQYSLDSTSTYVTVTVSFRQPTLIPGVMKLLGGGELGQYFNLKSSAIFKLEP